jgi:hypothetical protein
LGMCGEAQLLTQCHFTSQQHGGNRIFTCPTHSTCMPQTQEGVSRWFV